MPTGEMSKVAQEALNRRRHGHTGAQVVELARRYTTAAIRKLADLMEGKAGKITVLDKNGNVVLVDIEVPATVQAKCAEVLLERGYGKAPQAVFLKTDSPLSLTEGEHRDLPVAQKIQLMLEARAREGEVPIDLEASQQREIPASEEVLDLVVAAERPVEQRVEEEDAVLDMI